MSWLSDIRIFGKLLIGFMALVAISALIALASLIQLRQLHDISSELSDSWLPNTEHIARMSQYLANQHEALLQHVLSRNPIEKRELQESMSKDQRSLEDTNRAYEGLTLDAREKSLHERFMSQWKDYQTAQESILNLSNQNDQHTALQLYLDKASKQFSSLRKNLGDNLALNIDGGVETNQRSESVHKSSTISIMVGLLIVLFAALGIALFLAKHITKPLAKASEMMHKIANGEVHEISAMHIQGSDEPHELLRLFNRLLDKLRHLQDASFGKTGVFNMAGNKPHGKTMSGAKANSPPRPPISRAALLAAQSPAASPSSNGALDGVTLKEDKTTASLTDIDLDALGLDDFLGEDAIQDKPAPSAAKDPAKSGAPVDGGKMSQVELEEYASSNKTHHLQSNQNESAPLPFMSLSNNQGRLRASWGAEILDQHGQKVQAKLANIGADGLSLMSPNSLQTGQTYQAVLSVPHPENPTLKKEVRCRFQQASAILANGGQYRIDAKLIDLDPEGEKLIKQWMKY